MIKEEEAQHEEDDAQLNEAGEAEEEDDPQWTNQKNWRKRYDLISDSVISWRLKFQDKEKIERRFLFMTQSFGEYVHTMHSKSFETSHMRVERELILFLANCLY